MTVRTANSQDLPRIMELMRTTPASPQWSAAQVAEIFNEQGLPRVVLVLEPGESIGDRENLRDRCVEGFAIAHRIGTDCEIENVVVNPASQRRGWGTRLLCELLERVQQAGCKAVFLEVRESNRAARGLYEKCGFREVGRRVKYYAQPQEDAVLYRYSIDPVAS